MLEGSNIFTVDICTITWHEVMLSALQRWHWSYWSHWRKKGGSADHASLVTTEKTIGGEQTLLFEPETVTRTSAHATTFFYILLLRELSCDGWFEFGFSKVYIQFRQESMQLWVWSSDEKINDSKFFKIHTCMTNHSYNNHFLSFLFR